MACDRGVVSVESERSVRWLGFLCTIASLVVLMIASLGLQGCGCGSSGVSVEQPPPTLKSITIDPPTAKTPVGTTKVFTATEIYANGTVVSKTDNPLFLRLEWSTSNKSIATVDATGKATALKPGIVKVIATEKVSGLTASADLTVTDATLVTLAVTPATATTPMGTTQSFVATGTFTDGTTSDVTAIVSWSSSDKAIATIAADGKASALAAGKATITADHPATHVKGTATLTVTSALLKSLAVTPSSPSIPKGTTQAFVATGTYTDGTTKDLTASVTWATADGAIASIDASGTAKALAPGKTTVTATDAASKISGSTELTVTDAKLVSIAVTPPTPTIPTGTQQTFVATGTYSDGTTKDLTTSVGWTSSNTAVATVSTIGVATGQSPGTSTIEASDAASGIKGSVTLTVTDAVLVTIAVTPPTRSIAKGLTQPFVATGTYSDGSTKDLTAQTTWSSSDVTVASISNVAGSAGLATTLEVGTTTIKATDPVSTISGSTTLTVTAATLVSIAVTPATPSIAKGTTKAFTATGTYTDGTTQDLTTTVTWSTSSDTIATVSNASGTEGLAKGEGVGTATITATQPISLIAGSTTLTVTTATLVSIAVTPATPTIAKGTTRGFTATGTYTDGTTQNLTTAVTWSTSSAAIASVSNAAGTAGVAKGEGVGTATITATQPVSLISGSTTLTVTAATLVSIAVTPATPSIAKGTTRGFTATGTYTDGTTQDLTKTVTWSTSSASIASVSNASGSEGLAKGEGVGSATITATQPISLIAGSTTLTVTAATLVSIAVTPPTPSIAKGTTEGFTATGTYTDGTTQDLTTTVTWSTSSASIASVSNALGSEGLAKGEGVGTATITATYPISLIAGSTTLTVTTATLVSIAVTPPTPSIAKGTTEGFTATGTYTDGTTQDLTTTVTWSTSSAAIASVSNAAGTAGIAKGEGVGTATITATYPISLIAGSATLTVTTATLVSIAVTPPTPSIAKGTQEPFTATGTYSDGTTQDLTTTVSWSTSSGAIATISNAAGTEGVAKGEGTGTATITATYPVLLIAGSATLTVTAATLVSIDVTPANPNIAKGRTENFIATGTYSDGTNQDLTTAVSWSSSALSVATISSAAGSAGTATAVDVGMTTITATAPGMPIVSGSTTLTVTAAVLVSIDVSPNDPTLAKGTTVPLVAMGTYSDGSTSDLTTTVTWSSTASGIASVSNATGSEGQVNGVLAGTAVVSATDPTTMLAGSVTVTVTAAVLNSIQVNPTNPTIAKGTDQPFTATGNYSDGSTADLTTSVSWSSSVTTVATISSAAGSEGLATTVGVGTTTITATLGGTGISGSTTLTVSAATLVRIDVSPVAAVVPRSSFQDYTAIGIYSDSTAVDLTTSVTWSSSVMSVATISNAAGSEGSASTVSPGTTTIGALDVASGVSGTTTLTVTNATIMSIVVTPAGASLAKGGKLQYTAIATYTGGFTRDVTQYVSWSSSKPNVAGISNAPRKRGIATAKNSAGTATITATDTVSGVSGSTGLTVTNATLSSIAITPMGATIPRSTKQQYKAIGTYSDGSTADITTVVTWSSSNTAVATISNTGNTPGLASAIAAGTTTIGALDTNSGVSSSTTLTVSNATLASISLTPASPNVIQGLTLQLVATATYSDSSTKDVTKEVTWSTGNIAVAAVSNVITTRGVVTGIAVGSTSVTATYPLTVISGTTTVTVIP